MGKRDPEKAREYARQYRKKNRELLRLKARQYWEDTRDQRPPKVGPSAEDRFWAKVKRGAPDECWEWQGATSHGYGSFRPTPQRALGTHRFAWELERGPVPAGMHVLHRCDNPPCVNTSHLYLGTNVENARDRVVRGRAKGGGWYGERPPGWGVGRISKPRELKLSDDQIREIRARYSAGGCTFRSLAVEYDVGHATIKCVIHRIGGYARIE